MSRKSISFTEPNAEWLKHKIEIEGEYKSHSELINDLVRQQRHAEQHEIERTQARLIHAEKSGFTNKTPNTLLAGIKEKARADGLL